MPIVNGVMTITPDDIDLSRHLWDSFGNHETETSAYWLVSLAQKRGAGWEPFTQDQIEAFYSRTYREGRFSFNKLISHGYIKHENQVFHFTEDFITRCYTSSQRKNG